MTAVSNKRKNKIAGTYGIVRKQDIITAGRWAFLGLCAAASMWCDIRLAALAVVVSGATQNILHRYAALGGGLISCIFMARKDTAAIPYFVGLVIFAAAANFFDNDRYTVGLSSVALVVSKLILVCYDMPFYYKAFAVLEGLAVYYITFTVRNGLKLLADGKSSFSFADTCCVLTMLVCTTLALCGADSRLIYPGFAFALGLGWYLASAGMQYMALLSLFAGCVSLADKRGFAFVLLRGVVLWFVAACCAENLSNAIYPLACGIALLANVAFISQLNSFALTASVLAGLAVYTALPYMVKLHPCDRGADLAHGRDWRLLMLSMKKLEESLHFLATSVIDISRLGEKQIKTDRLEDIVADSVCRNCDKNTYCWQEKYSFTHLQFEEYSKKMHWAGENSFSAGFCAQCVKLPQLQRSFEENSRLLLSQKYIQQSQKNNQKLLQNAFVSVSAAVGDLIQQNQRSHLLNTTLTMETDRFLQANRLGHTYCLCSQNPDRVSFAVLRPVEEKVLYKIHNYIEKLYSGRFLQPVVEGQGSELLYIFDARPLYTFETAVETSRYKNVNGDNLEIFTHSGKVYVVLSDGMGTGAGAAAESCTVTAMAKSLITTGVSMRTAIDIINLALNLKGSGERGASVDIMETDLFTGRTVITKAGAGTTVVITRNGIDRYYADSLPLGILKDVKPVECTFTLKGGETAVVMSDGAGVISSDIINMYSATCTQIAQHIVAENSTQDDKTVVALRLKPGRMG